MTTPVRAVRLDAPTWAALTASAADRGVTVSDLIRDALSYAYGIENRRGEDVASDTPSPASPVSGRSASSAPPRSAWGGARRVGGRP